MSHGSESGASGLELRFNRDDASAAGSLSTERHAMKEQLEAVRATLNHLVEPPTSAAASAVAAAAMTTPPPRAGAGAGGSSHTPGSLLPANLRAGGSGAAGAAVESHLLQEIASRLGSIESMYGDISGRLLRMDGRVHANERTVRELQHLSAGAMNETARLVDYVGHRGSGQGTMTPGRHNTGLSLRGGGPSDALTAAGARGLDFAAGGQLTSTVQLHASQIHKLIAGLDFLEQHIIRQDAVVDDVQKQVALALQNRSPSELTLRVHDMSELLNKLRAHLYKVEKRSTGGEAGLKELLARVAVLEQRVSLGAEAGLPVPQGSSSSTNPLFGDASSPQRESSAHSAMEERFARLEAALEAAQAEAAAAKEAAAQAQEAAQAAGAAAGAAATVAALAELGEAVHEMTSKAYDDQLKALQERVHQMDEEVKGGHAELRELVEALHAQAQDVCKAEVQDGMDTVLNTVVDRLQADRERVMSELDCLTAQIDSCAQSAQIPDLVTEALANTEEALREGLRLELSDMVSASIAAEQEVVREMVSSSLATGEEALKGVLGAQAQELNAMLQRLARELEETREAMGKESAGLREDMQVLHGQRQVEKDGVAVVGRQVVELADRLEVTLAMAEEARALAQDQGQQLSRCLDADVDIRGDVEGLLADQERLKEAYGNLILDLGELKSLAGDTAAKAEAAISQALAATADAAEAKGVAMDARGVADNARETAAEAKGSAADASNAAAEASSAADVARSVAVEARGVAAEALGLAGETRGLVEPERLKASLEGAFISRDHLGNIFAAREDMARAVEKLEGVFVGAQAHVSPSKVLTTSLSGTSVMPAPAPAPASAPLAVATTSATAEAVQELGASHAATAATVQQLASRQSDMQSKLDLLLYRWDQAVRHDQLAAVSQATMRLEVQVRQQMAALQQQLETQVRLRPDTAAIRVTDKDKAKDKGLDKSTDVAVTGEGDKDGNAQADAVATVETEAGQVVAGGSVAVFAEDSVEGRLDDLEQQVSLLREAISTEVRATQETAADVMEAVHDLQLMVLELRSEGVGSLMAALQQGQATGTGAGVDGTPASTAAAADGSAVVGGAGSGPRRSAGGAEADAEYSFVRAAGGWDSPVVSRARLPGQGRRLSGASAGGVRLSGREGEEGTGAGVRTDLRAEEQALQLSALQGTVASLAQEVAELRAQAEATAASGAGALAGAGMSLVATTPVAARSTGRGSAFVSPERTTPQRMPLILPMPGHSPMPSRAGRKTPGSGSTPAPAAAAPATPASSTSSPAAGGMTAWVAPAGGPGGEDWAAAVVRLQQQVEQLSAALGAERGSWSSAVKSLEERLKAVKAEAHSAWSDALQARDEAQGARGEARQARDEAQDAIRQARQATDSTVSVAATAEAREATTAPRTVADSDAAVAAALALVAEARAAAEQAQASAAAAAEAQQAAQGAAALASQAREEVLSTAAASVAARAAEGDADSDRGAEREDGLLRDLAARVVELAAVAAALQGEQDAQRAQLDAEAPAWTQAAHGWEEAVARLESLEAATAAALQAAGAAAESASQAGAVATEAAQAAQAQVAASAAAAVASSPGREHAGGEEGVEGGALALQVREVQWGLQSLREGMEGMGLALSRLETQVRRLEDEEAEPGQLEGGSDDGSAGRGVAGTGAGGVGGAGRRRLLALESVLSRVEDQVQAHDQIIVDLMLQGPATDPEPSPGAPSAEGSGAVAAAEGRVADVQAEAAPVEVASPVSPFAAAASRAVPGELMSSPRRQGALQAALAATAAAEELGAKLESALAASAIAQQRLEERLAAVEAQLEGRLVAVEGRLGELHREADQRSAEGLAAAGVAKGQVEEALVEIRELQASWMQALGQVQGGAANAAQGLALLSEQVQRLEQGLEAVQVVKEGGALAAELQSRLEQEMAALAVRVEAMQGWQGAEAGAGEGTAGSAGAAGAGADGAELQVLNARIEQLEQLLQQQRAGSQQLTQQLAQQLEQQQQQLSHSTEQQLALSQQLNQLQQVQLQSATATPVRASEDGTWAPLVNSALESKVSDHGKALHLLRSRLIALQEVVDANRGAVAELQGGQGSMAARLELMEKTVNACETAVTAATAASAGAAAAGNGPSAAVGNGPSAGAGTDGAVVAALAAEVSALAAALASLQPRGLDAAHALEQVTRLAPRVAELETKLPELGIKVQELAAGVSGVAGEVAGLRSGAKGRLRRIEGALRELLQSMADITNIQKPSSKNPFSAIAPAGMNPAVLVLEQRFEALRTAMCDFSIAMADDCGKAE